MAKATTIKIKLLSTADTGFFYVTTKNSRTMTEKMSFKTNVEAARDRLAASRSVAALAARRRSPPPRSMLNSRKPRSSKS